MWVFARSLAVYPLEAQPATWKGNLEAYRNDEMTFKDPSCDWSRACYLLAAWWLIC